MDAIAERRYPGAAVFWWNAMKKIRDLLKKDMPVQIRGLCMEHEEDEKQQIYESCVVKICTSGNIELRMPQIESRVVLMALGTRCEVIFAVGMDQYSFLGEVKERYRKENTYIFEVEPKTFLKKCLHP